MFPGHLTVVLKPIDNICNLKCEYCYAKNEFGQFQDNLEQSTISFEKWFPELLRKLSLANEIKDLHFVWQGGEPLLLPKYLFKQAVHWQKSLLREDITWSNAIQTNGVLLNNSFLDLLTELGIYLGVSIDGPDYKHNRMRFSSRKIFEDTLNNIYNLSARKIPYGLFLVVHEDNYKDTTKIMDFIADVNPQNGIAFPPRFTSKKSFLEPSYLKHFFFQVFDIWWPKKTVYISLFGHILKGLNNEIPFLCYLLGRCECFITINSKGDIHSTCEVHNNLKIGNILKDSIDVLRTRHKAKIEKCVSKFKNGNIFELLGSRRKYIYFQGKGCPNRIVEGKDPFASVFADLISYISKVTQDQ